MYYHFGHTNIYIRSFFFIWKKYKPLIRFLRNEQIPCSRNLMQLCCFYIFHCHCHRSEKIRSINSFFFDCCCCCSDLKFLASIIFELGLSHVRLLLTRTVNKIHANCKQYLIEMISFQLGFSMDYGIETKILLFHGKVQCSAARCLVFAFWCTHVGWF